ncbi:MAG: beta-lactamase family protein [Alphaproteobacteria bacterium]|nr:beta-lactamase family protein [Alphaproteobacteria bacterium]MBU1516011.1 beta-lactamase family protein [Alphaproteobacteria bacterium]MBU2092774.1 beta-lactamase family protein [Alphaproteobacteria bacterium]MBU2153701.1 beta-lactamase family protein [Alphaproteobacteria bacterium]MBU2308329.1 beta-lactamase family protein [Alphaproteobacteria bacterium]
MRKILGLAVAAALAGGMAHAQVPTKPGIPSILVWTPQQQSDWYRDIESVYRVETVKRGTKVHPLPKADKQIDFTFEYGGKTLSVDDYMKAYNVSGVVVLKDGKVVLERYGMGRKPEDRWTSFSVAKSVTSTLVGAAIQDGKIKSLGAPVTDYIPDLKGSAYDGVTIRQLLMMSSGVKWNEDYVDPKSDVAQSGTLPFEAGKNPLVAYMSKLPRAHEPGTMFNYSTGETDLVGILVSNAVGKSLSQYASEKIWKPYGMERDAIWVVDPAGHERGGCCMSITLKDYARVGQFMLDGGKAGDKQILPADWTAQATTPQITNGTRERGYGYFWWMPDNGAFEARGIFGQSITVFRDDRIVIVTNAAWPQATGRELSVARAAFLNAARAAAKAM